MTIKSKIYLLSGFLLFVMLLIGGIEYVGTSKAVNGLNHVSHVSMPAVRNMTLVDMMHDGLRAVVYKALYISDIDNQSAKNEIAEELKEFTQNINSYMENINKLPLDEKIMHAIEEAKPAIAKYTASTEELTAYALAGKRSLAVQKLDDFDKAFSDLESKLENLGELIEQTAKDDTELAESTAERYKFIGKVITVVGLILSIIMSIFLVRELMSTLHNIIKDLTKSTRELSHAASQSATSATELSEASNEQAASLQETMASAEEISAMVNQNAESAGKVKDLVEKNQKATSTGVKDVDSMIGAISEIKSTNDEILNQMEISNKEFTEIVKIISNIGEKTKVIDDIVFQTKLLSFNASVEAARAGEHGKGFAVVAEEVGNLAQMSGNAAKQITDMLSASIKKVNEIVDTTTQKVDQLVEVGKDKIAMGQSTANKCREALNIIFENAQTMATMIHEIAHASKEQAQGVSEINKAISQLDQVTQQNTAVAQQSSTQAEQLNYESKALTETVDVLIKMTGLDEASSKTGSPSKLNRKSNVTEMNINSTRISHAKKVAGSDVVPTNDDSRFEEF